MKKRIFVAALFVCLFIFDWNGIGVYRVFGAASGIDISEERVGIGIVIGFYEEKEEDWAVNRLIVEVKEVFTGSSAQKTGIRVSDRILAINGIPVEEIGVGEIAGIHRAEMKMAEKLKRLEKEIFGHEGTKVVLRVKRDGCVDEKSGGSGGMSVGLLSIDFTVKREKNSVFGEGGK